MLRKAFLLALVMLAGRALALDPGRALTQYVHRAWSMEQGLPNSVVTSVAQTRDGYLWLGTQEGLVRFDGVRFVPLDRRRAPALGSNFVQALMAARDGALWIGTASEGGGLAVKRGETVASVPAGINNAQALAEDREGVVWVGSNKGLERGGQALSDAPVRALLVEENGVYAGTGRGLLKVSAGAAAPVEIDLPAGTVTALARGRDGALWIGTPHGLARQKEGVLTLFRQKDGLADEAIYRLYTDHDGALWIGTQAGGLSRWREGRGFESFPKGHPLADASVLAIAEDREGSLWIGTEGRGLHQLRSGKLLPIGMPEGLTGAAVYSVLEGRDGSLWIGTQNGGLNRLMPEGRVESYLGGETASKGSGFSLCESASGDLWVGTDLSGLLRLSKGRVVATHSTENRELPNNQVFAIAEEKGGAVWAGLGQGGAVRISGGRTERFGAAQGFSDNPVYTLLLDRGGTLWLGTDSDGLFRYDGRAFTKLDKRQGLASDTVLALAEGEDGSLWIAGYGGLSRLKGGRVTAFRAGDGLFSDVLYQAQPDGRGSLWMTCNRGIFTAAIADLDRKERGELATVPVTVYGRADGMRNVECNGAVTPAGWRARDGRLIFPTMDGIVVADPAHLARNTVAPPVALEELRADDQPVAAAAGKLVLPPGRGKLEIQYTALSFTAPERVRFRYRLEGNDPDWIDAGERRTAFYTNLSPGTYRFRVVAANEDGVPSREESSLSLTLKPHFWQTPWFLSVWVLLAALVAYGVHTLRVRRMRADFAMVLKERTRMAREIHDTLAQGLTGIVLQLEAADDVLVEEPQSARGHVARARKLAAMSLGEARRSVWALRSEALEAHDLPRAISEMAGKMVAGRPVTVEVVAGDGPMTLPPEAEGELFRIAQEALSNALKYSGASRIDIALGLENGTAWVEIKDDGRGFDPSHAVSSTGGGFGLPGMRERAERLGGSVSVFSEPGKGAIIRAEVPVTP